MDLRVVRLQTAILMRLGWGTGEKVVGVKEEILRTCRSD
jgi:hypothetical protein